MISKDCTITIDKGNASVDEDVYLYKNDMNIQILFTIVNNKYRYTKNTAIDNIIENNKASYAQVKFKKGDIEIDFEEQETKEGAVVLLIKKELIDEDTELGDYSIQIRLFDENKTSVITLPPVENCIHIQRPLFEKAGEDTNIVDQALTDMAVVTYAEPISATNSDGTYNKKTWISKEKITTAELNRMEEGISDVSTQCKDIAKQIENMSSGLDLSKLNISTESVTNGTKLILTDGTITKDTIIPAVSITDNQLANIIQSKIDDGSLTGLFIENDSIGIDKLNSEIINKPKISKNLVLSYTEVEGRSEWQYNSYSTQTGRNTCMAVVEPNTKYYTLNNCINIYFADAERSNLGSSIQNKSVTEFTTPENCCFVHITYTSGENKQVVSASPVTEFIPNSNLNNAEVEMNKISNKLLPNVAVVKNIKNNRDMCADNYNFPNITTEFGNIYCPNVQIENGLIKVAGKERYISDFSLPVINNKLIINIKCKIAKTDVVTNGVWSILKNQKNTDNDVFYINSRSGASLQFKVQNIYIDLDVSYLLQDDIYYYYDEKLIADYDKNTLTLYHQGVLWEQKTFEVEPVDFGKFYVGYIDIPNVSNPDNPKLQIEEISFSDKYTYSNVLNDLEGNKINIDFNQKDNTVDEDFLQLSALQLPQMRLEGNIDNISTDNAVRVSFKYFSAYEKLKGYIEMDVQGNTSAAYPIKNYSMDMYEDSACTKKLKHIFPRMGGIETNSYHAKANYCDCSNMKNLAGARLYEYIMKKLLNETCPNNGMFAVDGFPIELYLNDNFVGIYTLNHKQSKYLYGMDNNAAARVYRAETGDGWSVFTDPGTGFPSKEEFDLIWESRVPKPKYLTNHNEIQRLLKWVNDCTDVEFKTNLEQYFNKNSLFAYVIAGTLFSWLDNYAKNLTLATWDGTIWYTLPYDMDMGMQSLTTDYLAKWEYDSKLWVKLKTNFLDEIKTTYATLRKNGLNYRKVYELIEDIPSMIGENGYVKDRQYKYESYPDYSNAYSNSIVDFDEYNAWVKTFIKTRFTNLDTAWGYSE